MYKQPENMNRVKSMKNKFENLNDLNDLNVSEKNKKSPNRNIHVKINDKQKHNNNNNNLDKKKTVNSKENKPKTDNDKNRDKDFSSVNRKELCNIPPLNLTRQLNDPLKKGCIKRSPAFRKDKQMNNRLKNNDEFANIIKLFENNDSDTCDNLKNLTRTLSIESPVQNKVTVAKNNSAPKLKTNAIDQSPSDEKQNTATTATLKISEKESIDETNAIKTMPAYAQVVKNKKTDNNCDNCLTDSLKFALKQPLPVGPPPKKPPRTFTHIPIQTETKTTQIDPKFCELLNENLSQNLAKNSDKKTKSDPKLMLQKLENALLNNKIKSPKLPKKLTSVDCHKTVLTAKTQTQPNFYTETQQNQQKNIFPNCLSLNCVSSASSSNSYAKINPTSTFFADLQQNPEPIYAEPFGPKIQDSPKKSEFLRLNSSEARADTLSNSLHYMSNPVCDWTSVEEDVKNKLGKNGERENLTKQQFKLIMNRTYCTPSPSDSDMDSLPSTPSSDDTPQLSKQTIKDLIMNFEHKLEPNTLNQPQIKQNLTITTSLPVAINNKIESELNESDLSAEDKKKFKTQLNRTLTEIRKTYVKRVCSTLKRKTKVNEEVSHLFECCLLIGLNVSDLTPYIKNKFPSDYEVPPWIEHLCFPDATEWSEKSSPSNIQSQNCQCYSLVITNEKGDRKFGYCRRVVPEEASLCLPLTYCIISSFRAAGFYSKVLQELESRHGLPFSLQKAFVQELYSCKFPQPGESVQVSCLLRTLVVNSCEEMVKNNQITSPENVECVRRFINMQNGVYGSLNKLHRRSSENLNSDWTLVEENEEFTKICRYAKELRKLDESIDNLDVLRPKQNTSFVYRNKYSRNSEPQINKRFGQLFTDKLDKPDKQEQSLDENQLTVESEVRTHSPLLNLPNSQLLHDCLLGDVVLERPYDSRLEDADLTALFNALDLLTLIQTFGSLLHERKVILISSCLSKLSSCVEALESILYPFSWQHTFIPVLSNNMLAILSAPLPIIAGVLAAHIKETLIIEEGIAVNLDTSSIVCYMGDESDIIPKRLQKGLMTSLQLVSQTTVSDDRTRNVLVSEAFIRMFVEACGFYKQFIVCNEEGKKIFQREPFIKHHPSKGVKWFLEWFSETAMFNNFIQTQIDSNLSNCNFDQRCLEFNIEKSTANSKVTQKMKIFGQKLFH